MNLTVIRIRYNCTMETSPDYCRYKLLSAASYMHNGNIDNKLSLALLELLDFAKRKQLFS